MSFRLDYTEEELLVAFRFVLPEEDAQEMAMTAAEEIREGRPLNFNEETLVLLSLVSPEAAAKVERFRTWRRQGQPVGVEEERTWEEIKAVYVTHIAMTKDTG